MPVIPPPSPEGRLAVLLFGHHGTVPGSVVGVLALWSGVTPKRRLHNISFLLCLLTLSFIVFSPFFPVGDFPENKTHKEE